MTTATMTTTEQAVEQITTTFETEPSYSTLLETIGQHECLEFGCDGDLIFNQETNNWVCDSCKSECQTQDIVSYDLYEMI